MGKAYGLHEVLAITLDVDNKSFQSKQHMNSTQH